MCVHDIFFECIVAGVVKDILEYCNVCLYIAKDLCVSRDS